MVDKPSMAGASARRGNVLIPAKLWDALACFDCSCKYLNDLELALRPLPGMLDVPAVH